MVDGVVHPTVKPVTLMRWLVRMVTPPGGVVLDLFGPAKVPLVGTISGAGSLREPIAQNPNSRYMFNVRASYADETEAIVNQLVSLGLKNIAVFYQNDGFGKSGLDGITVALKKHNLAPTAAATVERNSTEVAAAVEAIAKAKPQAVIMVTLYKPTAAFVKAMKKANQGPMFMTLSPVGTEQLVAELGAAMFCASTGVTSSPREDHARYINNWLKALKSDKRFIFAAASQAQKAVDFLFSQQHEQRAAA